MYKIKALISLFCVNTTGHSSMSVRKFTVDIQVLKKCTEHSCVTLWNTKQQKSGLGVKKKNCKSSLSKTIFNAVYGIYIQATVL